MYPPLDTNFVCLSFSECYPPGLIWLFGRFDFFFFFATSVRCLFVFNPGSFTTRKVVFEVCSYYQSVYIPCKGSFDVQKRRQTSWSRFGPGCSNVGWRAASSPGRFSSAAAPESLRTGYYTAYKC